MDPTKLPSRHRVSKKQCPSTRSSRRGGGSSRSVRSGSTRDRSLRSGDRSVTSALFHQQDDGNLSLYAFSTAPEDDFNNQTTLYQEDQTIQEDKDFDGHVPPVAMVNFHDWDSACASLYTVDDESIYTTLDQQQRIVFEGLPKEFTALAAPDKASAAVLETMNKEQLMFMVSALMASSGSSQGSKQEGPSPTRPPQTAPADQPKEIEVGVLLPPWMASNQAPSSPPRPPTFSAPKVKKSQQQPPTQTTKQTVPASPPASPQKKVSSVRPSSPSKKKQQQPVVKPVVHHPPQTTIRLVPIPENSQDQWDHPTKPPQDKDEGAGKRRWLFWKSKKPSSKTDRNNVKPLLYTASTSPGTFLKGAPGSVHAANATWDSNYYDTSSSSTISMTEHSMDSSDHRPVLVESKPHKPAATSSRHHAPKPILKTADTGTTRQPMPQKIVREAEC
ncbi:expressed unknown protein [Seminavis robusta]|uniref:Uncharacterized protein n=1 Tax=Seminavis robusta TaxID=568900 RepID=A0A9N8EX49_9STRA|nr:expressed unknown protein [Seminavis robusta]|eukprot:Sro2018_g311230.1 n/a (445) ;mRNA; f:9900-11234